MTVAGRARRALDRAVDAAVSAAAILVLPVSLLLFLQWPLRELVQAYSREANDLAQILFALYVAVAITAATRTGSHIAADGAATRLSPRTRSVLARGAALGVLLPWSGFVLWSSYASVVQSIGQFEAFPETFNPGYFLIRAALALLALLIAVQALVDGFAPSPHGAP